ncbi:hypothetical protein B0G84_8741 [Paraburkholderia sp. BL8N3]|nr:hypothetical protein B0G84_8741 [Paraburkholderia sp. BL8N3]
MSTLRCSRGVILNSVKFAFRSDRHPDNFYGPYRVDVDHIDAQFDIGECSRLNFRRLIRPHLKTGKSKFNNCAN